MKKFFALRGELDGTTTNVIMFGGAILFLGLWTFITATGMVKSGILPSPMGVFTALIQVIANDDLIHNLGYSIYLNYMGYLEAVVLALPIGFIIGLFPLCKAIFSKYVDAIRFIPLTACTGIFIVWFGIYDTMKIQFLMFGIFVYLLPVVVERVGDVLEVYVQTAKTMGASKWQTIRTVFIPSVMSTIMADIRVLVAISWTYIIIAELVNKTGGVGSLIFTAQRQSRIDKVFAILMIIVLFGIIQDWLFKLVDKKLFPHKYEVKG